MTLKFGTGGAYEIPDTDCGDDAGRVRKLKPKPDDSCSRRRDIYDLPQSVFYGGHEVEHRRAGDEYP